MKHPASSDAKIRHKIVALPEDVAKLEALDQITDKQSAMDLAKIVNYAERLTNSYNLRLESELKDRKKLGGLLKDYMAAETEIQARAKERLKVKNQNKKKIFVFELFARKIIFLSEFFSRWLMWIIFIPGVFFFTSFD